MFWSRATIFSLCALVTLSTLGSTLYVNAVEIKAGSLTTNTSQGEADKIAIILSQQCLTALKNHAETSCPDYSILFNWDNTDHFYYGHLINDSGFFHRSKILVPNYYNIVKPNQTIIGVDPGNKFIQSSKIITIVPDGFTYINAAESVGANHTRNEYHDRYVEGCKLATISYSSFLLNDTISYLKSNCTKTNFVDHVQKQTGNQAFTFNNPYSTLHQQNLIHQIKSTGGMKNCITQQCNYTDPYAKVGYK